MRIGKKSGSLGYGSRGTAQRKLAIESLQNIAKVTVDDEILSRIGDSPELEEIIRLLRKGAMPVAEIARKLPSYDSDKLAQALERGGKYRVLEFVKRGDSTVVSLVGSQEKGA